MLANSDGDRCRSKKRKALSACGEVDVPQTTSQTSKVLADTSTPEKSQRSGKCTSANEASASASASRKPSAGPPQSVHSALLTPQHKAKLSGKSEQSVAIKSGRTQPYHNWWQQDTSNICLFGAHLIGDAEEPSQYASMALTDLVFCRLGFSL